RGKFSLGSKDFQSSFCKIDSKVVDHTEVEVPAGVTHLAIGSSQCGGLKQAVITTAPIQHGRHEDCISSQQALFELVAAGGVESCGLLEDELACCLEGLWTRDTETTQRARNGPCFLFRPRGRKCNSVTLPHPFFPFSHTSLDILSTVPPLRGPSHIMWQRFATLRTDDGSIRLDFLNCTRTGSLVQWQNAALKTKTLGNSKSVGKQLFEERHQDAHLLPGPEEREEETNCSEILPKILFCAALKKEKKF
ncbi:hypothetical protein PO909_020520, partial [Leuciscus waleckii]